MHTIEELVNLIGESVSSMMIRYAPPDFEMEKIKAALTNTFQRSETRIKDLELKLADANEGYVAIAEAMHGDRERFMREAASRIFASLPVRIQPGGLYLDQAVEFACDAAEDLTKELVRRSAAYRDHEQRIRAELLEALEMVRDADNDCIKDGLATINSAARAKIDDAIAMARVGA